MSTLIPAVAQTKLVGYRLVVLAMLVLVYTFNFIDRQIVGILAVPIKADLGLSDTQLGLMGGLAFALFYTALGIPIAMLADRSNRVTIMTVALVMWSAMTAVCGFAQNFWQLFLARLGVGVGEAGGVCCGQRQRHGGEDGDAADGGGQRPPTLAFASVVGARVVGPHELVEWPGDGGMGTVRMGHQGFVPCCLGSAGSWRFPSGTRLSVSLPIDVVVAKP
jgi:MFS family permease